MTMKTNLGAAIVGFLFALGLGISGMTQPQKVVGFLDPLGAWDPSLMFVMAGSILVHFFSYRWIRKRESPLFSPRWHVPEKNKITASLAVGSVLFGLGWGLGGYCPGPGLVGLVSLQIRPLIFSVSMVIGMYLFKILDRRIKIQR